LETKQIESNTTGTSLLYIGYILFGNSQNKSDFVHELILVHFFLYQQSDI